MYTLGSRRRCETDALEGRSPCEHVRVGPDSYLAPQSTSTLGIYASGYAVLSLDLPVETGQSLRRGPWFEFDVCAECQQEDEVQSALQSATTHAFSTASLVPPSLVRYDKYLHMAMIRLSRETEIYTNGSSTRQNRMASGKLSVLRATCTDALMTMSEIPS